MTFYNEKQKNDLIKAVNEKASELENLFVADNLRMIGCFENNNRMMDERVGIEYEGTDYNFLASIVAEEMDGSFGGYWQMSSEEVIELIIEMCESYNREVA